MNASMPGEPRKPGDADDVAAGAVPAYHASTDKRLSILEMRFDTVLPTLATKVDLAELRTEILTAQERLRGDIAVAHEKLRGEVTAALLGIRVEIATLSDKLHEDMNKLHRRLVMWIVSTMIAMFLGMVGLFVSISSMMLETTERMVQAHVQAIHATQAAPPRPAPSP